MSALELRLPVAPAGEADPSHPSGDSTEAIGFLRMRVARFGLVAGGLGFVALIFRALTTLVLAGPASLMHPSYFLHALGAGALLSLWLGCPHRARSRPYIHAVEAGGIIVSSICYGLMGRSINDFPAVDLIVMSAITPAVMARAVLVPSSARRTFFVSIAAGVGFLVLPYESMARVFDSFGNEVRGWALLMGVAMWWSLTVTLATITSSTIYGLRRQVRQAMQYGQYLLEEKIGEGGMGVVYRARHGMLRRPTAVKVLPADRAGERAIMRFEREVQLTARLSHQNTVFDYGRTPDGAFYYAMELLDGASLQEVVDATGPMPPARVIHVLRQIASALAEAHDSGLVHRDIKPANVFLCRQGGVPDVAKVLDFGLVREQRSGSTANETDAGTVAGTPLYMPPEAMSAPDTISAASDLYSLGALAYTLLTGKPVFEGATVVEICAHHLHTTPTPPSERAGAPIPRELEALVLECLAKRPEDRPRSAREIVQRLSALDQPRWTEEAAEGFWGASAALLASRRARGSAGGGLTTMMVDLSGR